MVPRPSDPRQTVMLVRRNADALRETLSELKSTVDRARACYQKQSPLPAPALSRRQLAILRLMEEGLSNEEIAERLNFSHGTIKLLVRSILEKFDTSNRTAAVARAIRAGLI